ncbi:21401_t:CDS:2 [Entrophospora sp. SA101]|nr:21394_t:CDS:2 [Entrophospora sp. SA101]CAJ0873087.1 21401_t:CDS:2 [Entrophospora sp. SA101]
MDSPFLSIAEDLLKALKEGIIGKNSGNGTRKNDKCAKTFVDSVCTEPPS